MAAWIRAITFRVGFRWGDTGFGNPYGLEGNRSLQHRRRRLLSEKRQNANPVV